MTDILFCILGIVLGIVLFYLGGGSFVKLIDEFGIISLVGLVIYIAAILESIDLIWRKDD